MTYPGGKGGAGVLQTIINQQPPHEIYIEPFFGSGAVGRAKRPARVNIGLDLDPSTLDRFADAGSRGWSLHCTNALGFLKRFAFEGSELVYCDPPYLMSTRRSQEAIYNFEMTERGHLELLDILTSLSCMVQISGYDSPLYRSHLRDWRLVQFQAATRRGMRTECLWMNYGTPEALHDYRFLGSDFRERERIGRKARRWVDRLAALPRLERQAIYGRMASSIACFDDDAGDSAELAITDDATRPRAGIAGTGEGRRRGILSPEMTMSAITDRTSLEIEVLQ